MSAPTTEEVREALARAERDDARASRSYSSGGDTAPGYEMALEVAEHRDAVVAERDALAAEVARLREALEASEARAAKAAEACEALETLVDYSSRMFHDSTRWESEDETGPPWQTWRNWAYDAIKAAKGAGR